MVERGITVARDISHHVVVEFVDQFFVVLFLRIRELLINVLYELSYDSVSIIKGD